MEALIGFGLAFGIIAFMMILIPYAKKIDAKEKKKTTRKRGDFQHLVENHNAILVSTKSFSVENTFTREVKSLFENEQWHLIPSEDLLKFRTRNPFGDILGLRFSVQVFEDDKLIWLAEDEIRSIGANEEIIIEHEYGGGAFSVSKHSYKSNFLSVEFYIPEHNPLFKSNEVRTAVGLPLVEKEKTDLEEFAELVEGLPVEIKSHADILMLNIARMENLAKEIPESKGKTERFIDKYIPMANSVLKAHKYADKSREKDLEVGKTLSALAKGSEGLLKQLQSKGDMDSEVAQTVIEQQLIVDGLINPLEDTRAPSPIRSAGSRPSS